jgi:hypothetical protein
MMGFKSISRGLISSSNSSWRSSGFNRGFSLDGSCGDTILGVEARNPCVLIWCGVDQLIELLTRATRRQPIANVALGRALRPFFPDIEDPNAIRYARQGFGNLTRVIPSHVIIVRQDDDTGATKIRSVLIAPLTCAASARGRVDANPAEGICILLTLRDSDDVPVGDRLDQLGQPIWHTGDIAQLPTPGTVAVRTTLTKILGIEANNLK